MIVPAAINQVGSIVIWNEETKSAAARAQQRARIEEVLFERENAELRNKSPEELRAMLDQLGK
jgi:hypothetical protein